MTQKQFTMDDIILIEKYFHSYIKTPQIVKIMGKKQPVYNVINYFKSGGGIRMKTGNLVSKDNLTVVASGFFMYRGRSAYPKFIA